MVLYKYIVAALLMMLFAFSPSGAWGKDRSVIDSLGRHVAVPIVTDRIGCLYAFTAHAVAMLGKADRIVAVSNGPRRDILLNRMYPGIRNALVPKYQGAINIEELARAKPDVVFVAVDTGMNKAEGDKLDTFGIPWIAVDFRTMKQQQEAIAFTGKAIGSFEKALEYNNYYRNCIERVRNIVSGIPLGKRVKVYLATNEPTMTSLPKSLPADWLEATGANNVAIQDAPKIFEGKNQLSIEQILLWNPEVILANEPGVASFIKSSPRWAATSGVKTGKVFQMPIGISRWGHPGSLETPLAILWTAKTLYPDKFRDINIKNELKYFYKTFFSYDLSGKMIERVLAGRGMRLTKDRKKVQ